MSVGGPQPWPGGEGAAKMQVQTDLDWDKFIRLYVERVTATRPARAIAGQRRIREPAITPENRHDHC